MSTLETLIAEALPQITEIRHDLHANPELGYDEHRTSEIVQRELKKAGVEFCAGLAGGTGVLGYLPATKSGGRTIALRADMDALPILENTGKSYASTKDGVMHACGHDGHTSILIGAASVLSRVEERSNNLLFVFQPAEEGGAGGDRMVKDGVLSGKQIGPKADTIFGLHGWTGVRVGSVSTRTGPILAAAEEFGIVVTGRGSHAAYPHIGIDPIVVAAHIVTALQSIASRSVSPLDSIVVTVGQVIAGVAHNVIPDTAKIRGTMRTLRSETSALGRRRLQEISEGVASAFAATVKVSWTGGYPVTFNDPAATDHFRAVARATVGSEKLIEEPEPSMGGEDFSFYGREIPACFYLLGLLPEGQDRYANLHSPEFDFNDDALPIGIRMMCELALS